MESVSNQNFTGDGEDFTKDPEAVAEAKSYSYVQFIRIWQVLWRIIMESSNNYTSSIRKQAELQNELYVGQMKRHQPYYCNLDRMISGGRILWNAVAICEMTETSWQMRNLSMNEDLGNPSRTCFVRGVNLGWRCSDCWDWRIEKLDASEMYPRRLNAKEVLITQKDGEFAFLVAGGSAKLSGRDYEFQEPTLRRESTVRRVSLSGESHGDREEFRPEE